MGRSEHIPRYGSVDSSSQQCMRTQEYLFEDVVISIQGISCHSSAISTLNSLISGGLTTRGHFCHQRNMSISWWQWIMSPSGLKPCYAGMLTACIKEYVQKNNISKIWSSKDSDK